MTPLLGFICARILRPDTNLLLIWADAYTFWIYLPAYPVATAAIACRRWVPAGAAVIVVVFHIAWVLPDYGPAEAIPAQATGAPRLRLMTANVYFDNPDFSGIAAEVSSADPDVLFLQEYGPGMEAALNDAGLLDRYPHRVLGLENPYFGTVLYSKLPLEDSAVLFAGGRPFIRATIRIDGAPVVLYGLHPTSPGLGAWLAAEWNAGWKTILGELRTENGPVVVAGDFNMNQHHTWYRKLKGLGLDSCHEERGRGNATTWPQGRKLRPIRIDHVFHSAGVVCLSIREGRGEGSDHRPLIAELAILP
ncbi:MAG: endonuclease/exonuclease/phosphatase family protein [Dehalococcoidia bacterium]|nr:endonuclease/exonuclease/phosphatase family protein [Dehalococcoidia bacterium]